MTTELDSTKVDPDHYQVAFEDDRVRVVKVSYGPGEESVMHSHPQQVAVFLTDAEVRFEYPDGTTEDVEVKAGEAMPLPPTTHRPINKRSEPIQGVLVELKD